MSLKKITNYLTGTILGSIILLSNTVYAAAKTVENCEKEYTEIADISRCFDVIKDRKERELTTWVNNQTFILEELVANTGRKAALNMFKRSQRNFTTYRENSCRWQYLTISPGLGAANAFKKCYILLTTDRINELKRFQ